MQQQRIHGLDPKNPKESSTVFRWNRLWCPLMRARLKRRALHNRQIPRILWDRLHCNELGGFMPVDSFGFFARLWLVSPLQASRTRSNHFAPAPLRP